MLIAWGILIKLPVRFCNIYNLSRWGTMETKLRFFKYLELWALLILLGVFSLYLEYGFKFAHLHSLEYLSSMAILACGVALYTLLLRHFLQLSWGQSVSTAFGINGVSFVCTTLPLCLFNLYASQIVPSYNNYSWLVSILGFIGYYILSFFVVLKVYPVVSNLLARKFSFSTKFKFLRSQEIFKLLIFWAVIVRTLFYAIDFYQSAYLKHVFIVPKLNLISGLILLLFGSLRMFIVPATVLMFFIKTWSKSKYLKAWVSAFKILILSVVCIVSTAIFLPLVLMQNQIALINLIGLDLPGKLSYIQALDSLGLGVLISTLLLLVIGCYLFNIFVIKYGYPEIDNRKAVRYLPLAFITMLLVVWGFNLAERKFLRPVLYQKLLKYDLVQGQ